MKARVNQPEKSEREGDPVESRVHRTAERLRHPVSVPEHRDKHYVRCARVGQNPHSHLCILHETGKLIIAR
jgi:hypothetical protein